MKIKHLLATAALTLLAGATFAGLVQPAPVTVDLDGMSASGDQYTARTAMNDVEFIGCGFRVIDDGMGGMFSFGFCQASDANENSLTCFTFNDNLIDAIKATSAYAFITFSWRDDGAGGFECIRVGSSTQSFYLPNVTTKGTN